MKTLITGGTGSLGTVLAAKFVQQGHELTILNKDSHKQAAARKTLPQSVRWYLGDICDRDLIREVCEGQDVVVHCVAVKRIEADPREMTRVNVGGTQNLALACREMRVPKCLFISSDKATGPTAYGSTKKCGESVWLSSGRNDQAFAALRYGNVLNSQGSIWHLWNQALKDGRSLLVRTPEPTRFILDLNYAVELVLSAINWMDKSWRCIFVPSNLPTFSVWDLAREMQPNESNWQMADYITGERQHEQLIADDECARPLNDLLWMTGKRYSMKQVDRAQFTSSTARRLTGKEVVERMQG